MRYPALATAAVLLFAGRAAFALDATPEQARKLFDALYGNRVKQAQSTPNRQDDVDLAREMLRDAAKPDGAIILVPLCDTAYDLASTSPQGAEVAVQAMQALALRSPGSYEACLQKILDLRRKQYTSPFLHDSRRQAAAPLVATLCEWAALELQADRPADAIAAYREALPLAQVMGSRSVEGAIRQMIDHLDRAGRSGGAAARNAAAGEQFRRLQQQFRSRPHDRMLAQKLTDYCVTRLDDPKQALEFIGPLDPAEQRLVKLAARTDPPLSVREHYDLGNWYAGLSRRPGAAQAAMVDHARTHLRAYLDGADPGDIMRIRAQLLLKRLDHANGSH